MFDFITQQRRGTTDEWAASNVIPRSGEFVIEECHNAPLRIKIGDGVHTFKDLQYIDETIVTALNDLKTRYEEHIAYVQSEQPPLEGSVEAEVDDAKYIDSIKHTSLQNAIQSVSNKRIGGMVYDKDGQVGLHMPYHLYLTDKDGNIIEETGVEIISGSGGGSGGGNGQQEFYISYKEGTTKTQTFFTTDKATLEFNFIGKDAAGDEIDKVSGEWKVNNEIVAYQDVYFGPNTFDLTNHLPKGQESLVKLIVRDGENRTAVKDWNVNIVELSVTSTFDDTQPRDVNKQFTFSYKPNGNADRTAYIYLDGELVDNREFLASHQGNGSYVVPGARMTHGSHLLEVFLTTTINNKPKSPDRLYRDIIAFDDTAEPAAAVIGIRDRSIRTIQYQPINIEYTVYQPTVSTPEVAIYVDGVHIKNQTLVNSHTDIFPWVFTEFTAESDVTEEKHTIEFRCGATRKSVEVLVSAANIPATPVTEGLVFDFNPVGRSNNDADRLWSWTNESTSETITMDVSPNFDWRYGGYQIEKDEYGKPIDGTQHFCIKAGTRATINYKLFADPNVKINGKEFKLIFKTVNVSNIKEPFLSCWSTRNEDSSIGIGIKMMPHNAIIESNNATFDVAYSENDIIEFEFNIDANSADVPTLTAYEDGVSSRILPYTDSHQFDQPLEKQRNIVIGSDYCDVYIYRCKAYSNSLDSYDILQNFISDSRTFNDLTSRHARNQIYTKGVLTPEGLAKACPDLRVYKLSAPLFTNDKDNKIDGTTIEQIYVNGHPILDNWTCYNCQHSGQGTSSNKYGVAARNLDFIMNTPNAYFELGGQSEVNKLRADAITLTRTSVPTNYLNAKVNVASSNNITNALIAKHFNDYKVYERDLVDRVIPGVFYDLEDGELVKKENAIVPSSFIKDTMEFFNCVIFIQETDPDLSKHREFKDFDYHLYAIGNIGDSKKTDNTRATDPTDPYECCVEILDVDLELSDFPVGTMFKTPGVIKDDKGEVLIDLSASDNNLNILHEGSFTKTEDVVVVPGKAYYRYDESTKSYKPVAHIFNADELHDLYEGSFKLTDHTTVDPETTYYVDVLEEDNFKEGLTFGWRYCSNKKDANITRVCKRAWIQFYKFITTSTNEEFINNFEEYMVKDSALYDYLFTLRYCMVDNRAKNTFWHFGKTKNYHKVTHPHKDLLPIYYEYIESTSNYVLTLHTELDPNTQYYTRHAFDLNWDYDNDTSLGLDNFGRQIYRYGLEDVDVDGNGEEVFREMASTFFNRIRMLFDSDLRIMYQQLEDKSAWHTPTLISDADSWQEQFPEELWRLDIQRKYLRTYGIDPQFLNNMCNGRMKYHRRQWLRSQNNYMSAKFASTFTKSCDAWLRTSTNSNAVYEITFTPYDYTYINIQEGEKQTAKIIKFARVDDLDKTYTLEFDNEDLLTIYGADAFSSFGDMSKIYPQTVSFEKAARLNELKLGESDNFKNEAFSSLGKITNPLLKTINIENLSALKGDLDLSDGISLAEVYAKGTSLGSIKFTTGGNIKHLELPKTITSLKFEELKYLTYNRDNLSDIKIEGVGDSELFNNVTTLVVADCPNIDAQLLLNRCRKPDESTSVYIRLTGLNWNLQDLSSAEVKEYFETTYGSYNGLTDKDITMPHANLSGVVTVDNIDGQDYNDIRSTYPELTFRYNSMPCDIKFFASEGGPLLYSTSITKTNPDVKYECLDPVTANLIEAPVKDPTVDKEFHFAGWSTKPDGKPLLESPLTNIDGNVVLYPTFTETTRQYEVKFYNNDNTVINTYSVDYGTPEFTYPDVLPQKSGTAEPEAYEFKCWIPEPKNIVGNLDCYASYTLKPEAIYELTSDDFDYELSESTSELTITNYTGTRKIIKIDNTYEIDGTTYTVTNIGGRADDSATAFSGRGIEYVDLPSTLKVIGEQSFSDNTTLEILTIPESVTEIHKGAFAQCSGLTEVYYNAIEAKYVKSGQSDTFPFYNAISPHGYTVHIGNNVTVVPASMFNVGIHYADENLYGCKKLTFAEGSSCTKILDSAFYTSNIVEVEFPDSITHIGSNSFGNTRLSKVILPSKLRSLGGTTFDNCSALEYVYIPASLKTMGISPFRNCPKMDMEIQPGSIFKWINNCLINTDNGTLISAVRDATIPNDNSVRTLADYAMYGVSCTEIIIPDGVSIIGQYAISYCEKLERVSLPDTVTKIDNFGITYNWALTELELPDNLQSLGSYALGRLGVSSMTIPASVTSMSEDILKECLNLTTVDIRTNTTTYVWNQNNPLALFSLCPKLTNIKVNWDSNDLAFEKINAGAPWVGSTITYNPVTVTYNNEVRTYNTNNV